MQIWMILKSLLSLIQRMRHSVIWQMGRAQLRYLPILALRIRRHNSNGPRQISLNATKATLRLLGVMLSMNLLMKAGLTLSNLVGAIQKENKQIEIRI